MLTEFPGAWFRLHDKELPCQLCLVQTAQLHGLLHLAHHHTAALQPALLQHAAQDGSATAHPHFDLLCFVAAYVFGSSLEDPLRGFAILLTAVLICVLLNSGIFIREWAKRKLR